MGRRQPAVIPRLFIAGLAAFGLVACVSPVDRPFPPPGPSEYETGPLERGSDSDPVTTRELMRTLGEGSFQGRLEDYLQPWVDAGCFSGVARVAVGGSVMAERAWGVRAVGGAAHTPGSRFPLASLTKPFTAGAILMLRDRGVLTLDDPLSRWLPGFPRGDDIRILHLLMHASGVAEIDEAFYFGSALPPDALLAAIAGKPPLFAPGSENRYSNSGYNLLAAVIDRASGEPYESFLQTNIFTPLGLRSTGFFITGDPADMVGHVPGPGGLLRAPAATRTAARGSGALISTAADLHRWGLAVAREELFSLDGLPWPFGWGKIEVGERSGLEQTGAWVGFTSNLALLDDPTGRGKEVVVILLNSVECSAWTRWHDEIASLFLGEPVASDPPVQRASRPVVEPADVAGRYGNGEETLSLEPRDGELFLYRDGSPVPRWLEPVAGSWYHARSTGHFYRFQPRPRAGTGVGRLRLQRPPDALIACWGKPECPPDEATAYARERAAGGEPAPTR